MCSKPLAGTVHFSRDSFTGRAGLLLAFYALAAAFFYSSFFLKVYIDLGDDWCLLYAPAFFFKANISNGIFPLWNPDVGFGVPEWIGISPLTIDRLFLFFMSPRMTWNLLKVVNFILSGWILSLYLLRRLGVFFPAFLGGLMISIAQLNASMCFASYYLFVMSFLLADRLVNLKSYSAGLVFSISLFLYALNAVPQSLVCAALFFFFYLVIRLRLHRNFDYRLWLLVFFPFLLAFMLYSPQIFRIKELLDLSLRTKVADKEVFSILPWEYLQMIWPKYSMISQDSTLNFIPGSMITALQNRFLGFASVVFGQAPSYGIFPFLATVCLFLKRNLKPFEKGLFLFAVFMLFIPILNPILYPITKHIPIIGVASGVSLFSTAYASVLLLVASILMALSLGYLSDSARLPEFDLGRIKKLFIGIAIFFIIASCVRLLIYAAFQFEGDNVRRLLKHFLTPVFSSGQFHQPQEFYAHRIAQASDFLKLWSSPQNAYFSVPVFLTLSSIAILYGRLTGKIGKAVFFTTCLVLLVLEARTFRPMSFFSPEDLAPLKEEADFIKKDKTIFRVLALQDNSLKANDLRTNDTRNVTLRPETQLIYGLSSPECYRALVIKDYNDYMSRMTVEGGVRGRLVGEFSAITDVSLLDLANIKYLIAPLSTGFDAFPKEHFDHVFQSARCNVFKNKFSKERAFLLHPQEEASPVILNEYAPHLVRLDVKTNIPNELVLTDQYYPGWVAYLDGIITPISKSYGTFRKIAVPKGQHKVEFRFQPIYLSHGMVIPFLGLIMGISVVFYEQKKHRLKMLSAGKKA